MYKRQALSGSSPATCAAIGTMGIPEMRKRGYSDQISTGTVWDPPLWIPYSSMMLGALLMILQYIAEIIKLTDEKDFK